MLYFRISDLPDSYIIREKIDDVTQLPKTNLDGSSHTNNGYVYKQFRGFEYYVTNPLHIQIPATEVPTFKTQCI